MKPQLVIDGKTVRCSFDKSKKYGAIHMVNTFAIVDQLVLKQVEKRGDMAMVALRSTCIW